MAHWRSSSQPPSAVTDSPRTATRRTTNYSAAASAVHRLDHVEATSEAHIDASTAMLDRTDHVFAVWDGLPARGYGGTADVTNHAGQRNLSVAVIWPDGATQHTGQSSPALIANIYSHLLSSAP